MNTGIVVRDCTRLEDFYACVDLQREIWGEADLEVEPATMFVVAAHTGGQVFGAFDGEKLVGYTLAVAAIRGGIPYLHSHMTGVQFAYRDRGVGRMLKFYQREEALKRGLRLVAWTFDPLELRNAHFNLNRLGAIARVYQPNLYGITTSPLHRGLATDRLLAEWYLDSTRVEAAIRDNPSTDHESSVTIQIPAELSSWQCEGSDKVATLQARIRKEFADWFAKGYAAVGVRKEQQSSAYLLTPWSAV
jgi:predicted GNAT superfamily acetyltransferase